MSTQFRTTDEARDFGIAMAGVDPKTVTLTEDADLRVQSVASFFFNPDDPDPVMAEEARKAKERDLEGQKGYRFATEKGVELGIVVAPFRDGFCVWGVNLQSGAAFRM